MKKFLRAVYSFVIRGLYARRKVAKLPTGQEDRILVIRTDGLGDLLLALPALKHLKESFRGCHITLLTQKQWVDFVQLCPYVDELIGWDFERYESNLWYRLRFIRELRMQRYAVAVHSKYSRHPLSDELLCCSLAAQKIGFDGDLANISRKQKERNDLYYTRLIKPSSSGILELDRNREFTEQIIGEQIAPCDFQPEVWLTESDRVAADQLLRNAGLRPEKRLLVALFPGASWHVKLWPFEAYAQLADRLLEHYGAQIIICGSARDAEGAARVQGNMRGRVVNLAGKTSLRELAAVLEACDLFIGNDTGPLHLAISVETPTLGIIGGGHFRVFYPYGDLNRHRMVHKRLLCYCCNWKCIYQSVRCIQEITVDDVWRETQQMMDEIVLPERGILGKSGSIG